MEPKIGELKRRGRQQARRAMIVVASGVAIGVVLLGGLVVYRVTRPATTRERLRRVLPAGGGSGRSRRKALRRLTKVPSSMRLDVGDRQAGEEQPEPRWQRVVVAVAGAAGAAAAQALAPHVIEALVSGRWGQPKE